MDTGRGRGASYQQADSETGGCPCDKQGPRRRQPHLPIQYCTVVWSNLSGRAKPSAAVVCVSLDAAYRMCESVFVSVMYLEAEAKKRKRCLGRCGKYPFAFICHASGLSDQEAVAVSPSSAPRQATYRISQRRGEKSTVQHLGSDPNSGGARAARRHDPLVTLHRSSEPCFPWQTALTIISALSLHCSLRIFPD